MARDVVSGHLDSSDVLIVGGGLAGGISAWHLARRGFHVMVLEKERQPHHKVCGEFLSGESLPLLQEIGVYPDKLGGVLIDRVHLHGPRRSVELRLPISAIGISRRVLDEEVLNAAQRVGAEIRRGVHARELIEGLDGPTGLIRVDTSEGVVNSHRLIVASGKTEFKSIAKRNGLDSDFIGFKMHLMMKPSLYRKIANKCDLFVFEHGYGGMAPIEDGLVNFCFLIDKKVIRSIGTHWEDLASHISHHNLAASHYLDGAEPQFRNFLTVAHIPYGFVRTERPEDGTYCVGDQMAVIPSLTGDGMSIALMTGRLVVDAIADRFQYRRLNRPQTSLVYQEQMGRALRKQVEIAFNLHRVFSHPSVGDWMILLLRFFPSLFDILFRQTRCSLMRARPDGSSLAEITRPLDVHQDLRPS